MTALTSEVLLKTRAAVEQVRSSRLETQIAIGRSRQSLAETRALIVELKFGLSEKRKQTVRKLKRPLRRREATNNPTYRADDAGNYPRTLTAL
jgi:hypothetical protein